MHIVFGSSRNRTGRIATYAGLVLGLSSQVVLAAPPSNDTCATAFDLNSVITPGTTPPYMPYHVMVDASMAASDAVDTSDFGPITFTHGIWYTFTPTAPGFLYYSDPNQFTGSAYSTSLFTLLPSCDGSAMSERSADPYYFSLIHGFLPEAYPLDAGTTLKVLVSTGSPTDLEVETSEPQFDLTFSFVPSTVPVNDTCATATTLVEAEFPYSMKIDNTLANDDATNCFSLFNGVWFTYTPSWTGGYLHLRETGLQSTTWATATACGLDATCLESETGNLVPLIAGQSLHILVGGSGSSSGIVADILRLDFDLVPDDCSGAQPISVPGTVYGNLAPAHPTPDLPGEWSCQPAPETKNDVWYSLEILAAGQYVFQVTAFDHPEYFTNDPQPSVAIFTECPEDFGIQIGCALATNLERTVTLQQDLAPGFYVVRVSSSVPKLRFRLDVLPSSCLADFNGINGVTVQDIFDFLTAWLAGNSSADFNGINGVTVQDIFDFLTAWLAGC